MIRSGWCRSHINKQVSRIKSMFRWAVEQEMVPGSVHHALLAVKGLKRGRCEAPESEPVRPVPEEHVFAIKPYVSRQVWAMIQVQLYTGARPGEVVGMDPSTSTAPARSGRRRSRSTRRPTTGTTESSSSGCGARRP